ncbi:MAG: c-type cytochrome [Devosiaceae bacterium]|nr:c-type cytochrome [Devosiaceae bacterium]
MKNFRYYLGLVLLTAVGGVGWWVFQSQEIAAKPGALFYPDDVQLVAEGKELYGANCASCHGVNLEGAQNWKTPGEDGLLPAPPHDETGHTWHHPDEMLFGIIKFGLAEFANLENYKTNMPIYKDSMSDEEIVAVFSYIKSTWPQEIQNGHDEMNQRNAEAKSPGA